jgi:hypothetical protein
LAGAGEEANMSVNNTSIMTSTEARAEDEAVAIELAFLPI